MKTILSPASICSIPRISLSFTVLFISAHFSTTSRPTMSCRETWLYPQLWYRKNELKCMFLWIVSRGVRLWYSQILSWNISLKRNGFPQRESVANTTNQYKPSCQWRLSGGLPCHAGWEGRYFSPHHACQDVEIKAKTQLQLLVPALDFVRDSWAGNVPKLPHFHLFSPLPRTGCSQLSSTWTWTLTDSSWKESYFTAGKHAASSFRLMLTRWPTVCRLLLKNTGWNNQRVPRTDTESWSELETCHKKA